MCLVANKYATRAFIRERANQEFVECWKVVHDLSPIDPKSPGGWQLTEGDYKSPYREYWWRKGEWHYPKPDDGKDKPLYPVESDPNQSVIEGNALHVFVDLRYATALLKRADWAVDWKPKVLLRCKARLSDLIGVSQGLQAAAFRALYVVEEQARESKAKPND